MSDMETQAELDSDEKLIVEELDYSEEIFTIIKDENYEDVIPSFCESIFRDSLYETSSDVMSDYMLDLRNLLKQLPRPFTIVQEFYHIDSSYRDTYYTYFSNQHFHVKRYSRRLSFFAQEVREEDFFAHDTEIQKQISDHFMGACVLNPLTTGVMGRTLINPQYVVNSKVLPIYVRLSRYELNIYGKKFFVDAFPYRMQDEETMRCAEVTILNLLEHYANSYRDYRSIVPSEILENEQKHSHERVLPSRGISYPILTKVLSEFGFSPRLYNLSSIDKYSLSKVTQEDELKRNLHYYIESGIPVALNLLPTGNNGSGHSIVCIGHGNVNKELIKKAKRNKWISWDNKDHCHPLINSADFYEDYVVVDDNQPIYQVRPFQQLSLYPDMRVENIAVPLYKRMFLDASDAAAIVRSILHHEQFGIDVWADGFLDCREDVVIRLFMASSRSLKYYRSKTLKNFYARETYAIVPMPRFVWVCELYRTDNYEELKAFGEIIIDATSALGRGHSACSLILMHYPNVIGIRYPEQTNPEFDEMIELEEDDLFDGYRKNLNKIPL